MSWIQEAKRSGMAKAQDQQNEAANFFVNEAGSFLPYQQVVEEIMQELKREGFAVEGPSERKHEEGFLAYGLHWRAMDVFELILHRDLGSAAKGLQISLSVPGRNFSPDKLNLTDPEIARDQIRQKLSELLAEYFGRRK